MSVTKRTRFEVLRRDGHTCRYCGATAPDATLTVDHVLPVALGGTDGPENLVTACRDCIRWAAAIEKAAENALTNEHENAAYLDSVRDAVDAFTDYEKPDDWCESIYRFRAAGLPAESLLRSLLIGADKRGIPWNQRWRYACGTAWRMLTSIQEEARRILHEDDEA